MTLKELLEKRAAAAVEIKRMADLANDDSHDWSAEDEQAWERVNNEYDELEKQHADAEERQKKADRAGELMAGLEDRRRAGLEGRVGDDGSSLGEVTEEHRALALQAWLREQNGLDLTERHVEACERVGFNPSRTGLNFRLGGYGPGQAWTRDGQPLIDRRGLTVGTPADGGYTIPTGFVEELERAMLGYNGPRQAARVIRTATGNQIEWPTADDTGNTGALLAESTTIGASVDPAFGQKLLDAYKYSSKPILISAELLQDSAFDMARVISSMLAERLGRIQAAHFTTGTGTGQPHGVVTASTLGKTAASATAIAADELLDLVHSIDPAYRSSPSVGFMFHDGILLALRKLKDGDSQYLWQPGLQSGTPDRILGFPYVINQNMQATIATGTKTVLFGDFNKFIIRDVATVRMFRLEERYRDLDQTGFVAFMRSDSECIQTSAIKHLIQA